MRLPSLVLSFVAVVACAKPDTAIRSQAGGVGGDSTGGTGGDPGSGGSGGSPPPPPDTAPLPPDKQILFVVGSTGSSPGDAWLTMHLTMRGFQVTPAKDDDEAGMASMGKGLVIISSSASYSRVAQAGYTTLPLPVIVMQLSVFDDLKMTGRSFGTDFGNVTSAEKITIVDGAHPLAAGLMGEVSVYVGRRYIAWGLPAASAAKVASVVGAANHYTIFSYKKGDMMVGLAAPAKRVGFFAQEDKLHELSKEGTQLVDAAVDWALAP